MFQSGYRPGSVAGFLSGNTGSTSEPKLFTKPGRNPEDVVKEYRDRAKILSAKLKQQAQADKAKENLTQKTKQKIATKKKAKILKNLAQTTTTNSDSDSSEDDVESKHTSSKKSMTSYPARQLQREKKKEVKMLEKDKNSRSVFVGNLPNTVKKKIIKRMFQEYGTIESIRYRSAAPANPKIPKKGIVATGDFHPEIHTFNAYVVFNNAEAAQKALKLNGKTVDDRHIRVDQIGVEKPKHDHQRSVFIGNLPFEAEEEDVLKFFQDCGEIDNVRLIKDKFTRLGKGFGYVLFADKDSVILALKMNGLRYKNRNMRVVRSTAKPLSSADKKDNKKLTQKKRDFPKVKHAKRKRLELDSADSPAKKMTTEKKFHGKFTPEKVKMVGKKKEKAKKKLRHRLEKKRKQKLANILTGKSSKFRSKDSKLTDNKSKDTVKKSKHISSKGNFNGRKDSGKQKKFKTKK